MKYCTKCGAQMMDEAVICVTCGSPVNEGMSKETASEYVKRVKDAKTLSIVSISITGAYFLTALCIGVISYLLFSIFAALILLFSFFVDLLFIAALIIFNSFAITKACGIVKDIEKLPDSKVKTELENDAKLARTLAIIGVVLAAVTILL